MLKKVVLPLLCLLTFLFPAVGQEDKSQSWQELEKKVLLHPWDGDYIDTLRGWYGIDPQANKQTAVKCLLPKSEKIVFRMSWGKFTSGYAFLENNRTTDTLRLLGKVVTTKFVDRFFVVRDYAQSLGSSASLYPYFFEQTIDEDGIKSQRWTLFDQERLQIHRHNGRPGTVVTHHDVRAKTYDFLSLLYMLRTKNMVVGRAIFIPCFVHDKYWNIRIDVVRMETIETIMGPRNCYVVEPVLVGTGEHGFNAKDKMSIWFTADDARIPVRIKTKARVGYATAEMVYYTNGKSVWKE